MMQVHPKLGRELRRIKDQMGSWVMRMYEPWLRRQRLRHPERYSLLHSGAHRAPSKLAIYLVYQPTGLSASTLKTLQHFNQKGYAVFLVSNAPLTPTDLDVALPHCWKVMERSNFGYDFGGYQDAIRHLWSAGLHPGHLVIMNDSIWFPLRDDCDLLTHMEHTESPFTGAFQLEPTRKKNPHGKKRPFMGSFFWHFKQEALESSVFTGFWNSYRATSSKYATIRRGERRFTHHMRDAGVRSEGVFSRLQFDEWITGLSDESLKHALGGLCSTDPYLEGRRRELLAVETLDAAWKEHALSVAQTITKPQNIMATAPVFMVRDRGLPFLKKAADPANLLALHRLIEQDKVTDWIHEPMLSEIRTRLSRFRQARHRD